MLRKLCIYELKTTSRNFIPMYLIYIAISIVNMFCFENGFLRLFREGNAPDLFSIISIFISCIYFLCMFAVYILTYVFIVTSFYKTTAGQKGYFTFSLPVKSFTIINSKFFVAVFWQIITCGILYLSIQMLCSFHGMPNWIVWLFDQMEVAFGATKPALFQQYKFLVLVASAIGILSSPLQFYLSIAIGQLFSKNRAVWSVCFYFVIYTILQVLSSILLFSSGFTRVVIQLSQNTISIEEYMQYLISVLKTSFGFTILSVFIIYGITQFIYHKKLNVV